ncbi:ATP-dependent helicase [Flavobacterium phragmitis]|uniref:DNA 3'-5' helicase n=1 Tax=Flavobacterium phragmitis TaxID=739143 RepID=A0A1I1QGL1_9FLAO|nr:ATP-dependent helicase [Flavobacterium phragmitis]SFD21206.1 DNA helicase-2 / ATP-dependent DNA helicase PcrA [Flavobacterium phragmitis]
MNKINLSQKQSEIVDLNTGSFLIEASAGSGKTRVLTERVKKLLENNSSKILAITFTNKASEELKERIDLDKHKNKNIFIGTFHSFCQTILEARFKLLGFPRMPQIFEDENDRIEIVEEALKSIPAFTEFYNNLDSKEKPIYKSKVLSFISSVKRELAEPEDLITDEGDEHFLFLYNEYQDILKSNNAVDFDDLILLVYKLFANNEAVQNLYSKSYNHIFIDEGQDLNKAQYYLLKSLCGNQIKNVMIVGDPNQSIYGFNGSTPKYMRTFFIEDFNAKKINLEENYRCSKKVIDAANKLMNLKVEAVNYVIEGKFEIYKAKNEKDEGNFVVENIKNLINLKEHNDIEGLIDYNSIAILGRNKFVFKYIEDELQKNNIPYYFKSGNIGIKFQTTFMKLFDNYFRIKINPSDKLHAKRLKKLLKIEDFEDEVLITKSKYPYFLVIQKIIQNLNEDNFKKSLNKVIEEIKDFTFFSDDEKLEIYNEVEELKNLWIEYSYNNIKPNLIGFKNTISLGILKKDSKQEGICLSTVHTMKGQESEIVFLIGLDDGTFPYYLAIQNGEEDLLQEKNNLYVAFTRAKRFLFISYPSIRIMPWGDAKMRSISRFLKIFNK